MGDPGTDDYVHVTTLNAEAGVVITAGHAMVSNIPGVNLYPYQLATISAMRDIENTRVFSHESVKVKTNALRLGSKLGSGKTYVVQGLIRLFPTPRAIPSHVYIPLVRDFTHQRLATRLHVYPKNLPALNEVQIRYTNFLKPTVILVGSGVLDHWINVAKQFNLKYFAIGDVRDLRKFYDVFRSGHADLYDEIIVPNGTVTTSFTLASEAPDSVPPNSIRPIIEVLKLMTENYCWSRAVYDDFETIRIPPTATTFPALFTVYVSATLNDENTGKAPVWDPRASTRAQSPKDLVEYVRETGRYLIKDVPSDELLHSLFTIRCDDQYVDDCVKMPMAFRKIYVYTHSGKVFMQMLGSIGMADAKEVLEMISGDAIGTAASRLGIQTNSVAEIARKVLNDNFDRYRELADILANVRMCYGTINDLPEYPEGGDYSAAVIERYVAEIMHRRRPPVQYYSASLLARLDVAYRETEEETKKLSAAVRRVQDNFRDGECAVCLGQLIGVTVFISTCCNVVLCGKCISKACRLRVALDEKKINGMCPKCRVAIDLSTNMIALDANFNASSLLDADPLAIEEPTMKSAKEDPKLPAGDLGLFDDVSNVKVRALLNIIHGIPIRCLHEEELMMPNLMYGHSSRPVPPDEPRRMLVFANYDETLDRVKTELRARNISCDTLGGTYSQMTQTISKFQESGLVLLVNSKHYCAGINLQFCTDVVFMHRIQNEHCEQQVCGRAQRIGRKYNLTVHYLTYENEDTH